MTEIRWSYNTWVIAAKGEAQPTLGRWTRRFTDPDEAWDLAEPGETVWELPVIEMPEPDRRMVRVGRDGELHSVAGAAGDRIEREVTVSCDCGADFTSENPEQAYRLHDEHQRAALSGEYMP